ncbi:hypothetical protein BKI52_13015 [marine bacterium AO1-C]|nr:hypothetical protein BKI52_13015 [marine bacterium AO1-C]
MNYFKTIKTRKTIYLTIATMLMWVGSNKAQNITNNDQTRITAFVNVHVLTMSDSVPRLSQTVIIENGKIAEIGASGDIQIPENALVIDGQNQKFLIPGLTDTHVHLHRKKSREWIRSFVHSGVTTVFNLAGRRKILKMRDDIRAHKLIGPDIYTAGYGGVMRALNRSKFKEVTLEKIEKAILKQKKQGYDMLKIANQLTIEQYAHILKVAKREGMHVTGHIPRNLKADDALRVGQNSFAHTEEFIYTKFTKFDEKEVVEFAKKVAKQKSWLIANIIAYEKIRETWGRPKVTDSILKLPETKRLHPSIRKLYAEQWYGSRDVKSRWYVEKVFKFYFPIVRHFHQAGVKILVGTDTAFPLTPPGESVIDEIKHLTKAGLSPYESLKAATANPGEYIKHFINPKAKFGQIKENYKAHLVLLDTNPLNDLDTLKKPVGVMLGGKWYNKEALDKMVQWD